jgi:Fe-S cluster biogenesis protein NfuA
MADQADLYARVDAALDTVRPHLAVDGGNIEIVEIDADNNLHVKWLGACSNCSMSVMTMRAGVEDAVLKRVPEINSIKAVNGLDTKGGIQAA